ncbi:1,4-alpha-glucan branching protein GlgB [Frankia sp. AgB1.9]|uniref:1,4-alpha-glucan branching protein GlgB n=1 Tax=unclassified Frankia TaxID=2632575 RepID=UPI001933825D|nr:MULTISPECIES: 1,4-alpha-glucan branching protein GlgB [unclassified Frankia]MBL7492956.1 1,4-alpha-glucan branching protein GlgB [Frankia sp. AgW1.1]MBL7549925.1 1,4-alpha-glucan branching protein GlgB [Frankia sp. AgB1.9]MBL7620471.1 1,4-alpha-glucan branching protein GlgB [Frankia sp. AgB1.8]
MIDTDDGRPRPATDGPALAEQPVLAPPGIDLPRGELDRLVGGRHHQPHGILGAHPAGDWTIVRALRPDAVSVTVVVGEERYPTTRLHSSGVFAVAVPIGKVPDYRLEVAYPDSTFVVDDPYRYLPTVGEVDLHLIAEGRHERLWTVLGAHVRHYPTPGGGVVSGVSFAVWAPNARGVRVVGDFDFWDGRAYPLRSLGHTGIWELFVPGVEAGTRYKFEILGFDGVWRQKADPMATHTETPPATASVVFESDHVWSDEAWMAERAGTAWHAAPISVYEVHLGSWRRGLSYRQLATELVDYVREAGFTHVELLPVAEHPFGGSWGYQVSAYYAPTSRFGSPDDFRYLVDALHQAGIGVLVDWVPAHFPRDNWALGRFDGTALYEHGDPRRGEHPDWGTFVFDFGRPEVRNFLVANALYWFEAFHIDGLRVDAVASMLYLDYSRKPNEWIPNIHGGRENLDAVSFLQEVNATVYRKAPGAMMIAEESTAWPGVTRPTHLGGLGFGFKWNMGWMHDTLDYMTKAPIYRMYHHHQVTFSMVYAYSENYMLPFSHDEVVHGKGSLLRKMPGDRWQQLANLRALYAYMWAHPGKQLLFMGCEFGQDREWDEATTLDWGHLDDPGHRGVFSLVGDLNRAYRATPALWARDNDPSGFGWIDANDAENNVLSFLRFGEHPGEPQAGGAGATMLACVTNFSGSPHYGYRLGLPRTGRWREVLNTDAGSYGGAGQGNLGEVTASAEPHHGQPASAPLTLPALATLWFAYEGE